MSTARETKSFKVIELKEILKSKGLSTSGSKSELLNRLMVVEPCSEWLQGGENKAGDSGIAVGGHMGDGNEAATSGSGDEESSRTNMAETGRERARGRQARDDDGSAHARQAETRGTIQQDDSGGAGTLPYQRELELYQREKELAERELAIVRRELELLRRS